MKTDPRADEWASRVYAGGRHLTDDELQACRGSIGYASKVLNLALRDFGRVFASETGLESAVKYLSRLLRGRR